MLVIYVESKEFLQVNQNNVLNASEFNTAVNIAIAISGRIYIFIITQNNFFLQVSYSIAIVRGRFFKKGF